MGKPYRHTLGKRIGNGMLTGLVRRGKGPAAMRLVRIRGRRTGREYATPIWILTRPDGRYWVAVLGDTNTIKNARAAGQATLVRGASQEDVSLLEVPVADRVPLLRAYIQMNNRRMTRQYFGATPDSTDEQFAAIAPQRTVFKVLPRSELSSGVERSARSPSRPSDNGPRR